MTEHTGTESIVAGPSDAERTSARRFLARQLLLIETERAAEHAQQALLLAEYPPKVLARNGLALLHLNVSSTSDGANGSWGGDATLVELVPSPAYHSDTSTFPPHTFRPGDIAELQDEQAGSGTGGSAASTNDKGSQRKGKGKAGSGLTGRNKASSTSAASSASSGLQKSKKPLSAVVYRVYDNKIVCALKVRRDGARAHDESDKKSADARGKGNKSKAVSSSSNGTGGIAAGAGPFRLVKVANDATYDRMRESLLAVGDYCGVSAELQELEADQAPRGPEQPAGNAETRAAGANADQQGASVNTSSKANAEADGESGPSEAPTGSKESSASENEEGDGDSSGSEHGSDGEPELGAAAEKAEPAALPAAQHTPREKTPTLLMRALLAMAPFIDAASGKVAALYMRRPRLEDLPALPVQPPFQRLNDSQLEAIRRCLPIPSAATEAARAQTASLPFHLIHGPPGTGKTTTIVELLLQIALGVKLPDKRPAHQQQGDALRPARVLVCGASNLAVDTIAERLLSPHATWHERLRTERVQVTRLGHPARVLPSVVASTLDAQREGSDAQALLRDAQQELKAALAELYPPEKARAGGKAPPKRAGGLRGSARRDKFDQVRALRKELRARQSKLTTTVLTDARIVLSTLHGAGDRALSRMHFDYIIIDEACQAMEASCWSAVLRAREDDFGGAKLILAGDHKQLGPTVKASQAEVAAATRKARAQARARAPARSASSATAPADGQPPETQDEDTDEEGPVDDDAEKDEDSNLNFVAGEEDEGSAPETTAKVQTDAGPKPRKAPLQFPRSLETTMFDRLLRLYGARCKSLLSVQYRMNEEIMAFPNRAMYGGKLSAHESCQLIRLVDLQGFDMPPEAEGQDEEQPLWAAPVMFLDTAGAEMFEKAGDDSDSGALRNIIASESKWNEHEVDLVAKHVKALVEHGLKPEQIAIIAPYSAQVAALSGVLRPLYPELEVGTVDGMQGREKDAIILTLVRSNEAKQVGFLRESRRLNVAMTRAKRHLAVIGDSDTVGGAEAYLRQWIDHLQDNAVMDYACT